jgi:hypothetical protein
MENASLKEGVEPDPKAGAPSGGPPEEKFKRRGFLSTPE